jgi:hypothetical protein
VSRDSNEKNSAIQPPFFILFIFILKFFFTVAGRDSKITTVPTYSSGFLKSSGGVISNVKFFQEPAGVHCQNQMPIPHKCQDIYVHSGASA